MRNTLSSEICLIIDFQEQYLIPARYSSARLIECLPDIRRRMPLVWVFFDSCSATEYPQIFSEELYSDIFNRLSAPDRFPAPNAPIVEPRKDDFIMTKRSTNAFELGTLEKFLNSVAVQKVYLAGHTDQVCVLQSALGGLKAGFYTSVLHDLTGQRPEGAGNGILRLYHSENIPYLTSKELLLSPSN